MNQKRTYFGYCNAHIHDFKVEYNAIVVTHFDRR